MLKVTVSGSYSVPNGKNNDIRDFEEIVEVMPDCKDEAHAIMYVRSRFMSMWLKKNGITSARDVVLREVYIEDIEKVDGAPKYKGKDIKEMTMEEIQELAADKDLRRVPLWKDGSLINMRRIAYIEYTKLILRKGYTKQEENDFNLRLASNFTVDGDARAEAEEKLTNEQILDAAEKNQFIGKETEEEAVVETAEPEVALTVDELRAKANILGLKPHPQLGEVKLKALVEEAENKASAAFL